MSTDQIPAARRSPPRVTEVRGRVTDVEEHARTLIRQRPVVAVLAAVGVGYLVARLVSRAMR